MDFFLKQKHNLNKQKKTDDKRPEVGQVPGSWRCDGDIPQRKEEEERREFLWAVYHVSLYIAVKSWKKILKDKTLHLAHSISSACYSSVYEGSMRSVQSLLLGPPRAACLSVLEPSQTPGQVLTFVPKRSPSPSLLITEPLKGAGFSQLAYQ